MAVTHGDKAQAIINTAIKQRGRLHSGRSRVTTLVVLAALCGVGLFLSLVVAAGSPNASPSCGGEKMASSDVCHIFSTRGGGGTYTYQQMADRRESGHSTMKMIGYGLAAVTVLLMVPTAKRLDPSKPWGSPVAVPCPRCRATNLREQTTTHSITRGRTTYTYTGIVTLCTPACGYSSVRQR